MKRFLLLVVGWAGLAMCGLTGSGVSVAQPPKLFTHFSSETDSAQNAEWAQRAPITRSQVRASSLTEQKFMFRHDTTATFVTQAGFLFRVPANGFLNAQNRPFAGRVAVSVREAVTVLDFLRAGLVTVADHAPVRSGGMFQITITDATTGAPLRLAPGSEIYGEMPQMVDDYFLSKGIATLNGGLDWVNPVPINPPAPPNPSPSGWNPRVGSMTGFSHRSLFPVPDSMVRRVHQYAQWADSITTHPIYNLLMQNRLPIYLLDSLLKKVSTCLPQLRRSPCPNPGQWSAWLQTNVCQCTGGLAYGWMNGKCVLGESAMKSLGLYPLRDALIQMNVLVPVTDANGLYDATALWPFLNRIGWYLANTHRHYSSDLKTLSEFRTRLCEAVPYYNYIHETTREAAIELNLRDVINENEIDSLSEKWKSLLRIEGQYCATRMGLKNVGLELVWNAYSRKLIWVLGLHWNPQACYGGYMRGVTRGDYLFEYLATLHGNFPAMGNVHLHHNPVRLLFTNLDQFHQFADSLDENTRQANAQRAALYGFRISERGWYNCDIYMREPWQPHEVIVQLDADHTPANTQLYVVYPAERMVFQFPIGPSGATHVRLFDNYTGHLLLVSGERASATPAARQDGPLRIAWQGAEPLGQVAALQSDW